MRLLSKMLCVQALVVVGMLGIQAQARAPDSAGRLKVLVQFNESGTNGNSPVSQLLQVGPLGYVGDTAVGGKYGAGLLYEVTSTGAYVILYNFTGGADGSEPGTLTRASDGSIYGTTAFGGVFANGCCGTIFRLTPFGKFETLYTFNGAGTDGGSASGVIQADDGHFYGTSSIGDLGYGGIFEMSPGAPLLGPFDSSKTSLTELYDFPNSQEMYPSQLVEGGDGAFYGTLSGNGTPGYIFRVTSSGEFTILYSFTGGADGMFPKGLVLGPDGVLYGVTYEGGANGAGTLFSITPSGTFSVVHGFANEADGGFPESPPTLGADHNLYGTTETGGQTYGVGTIYQYTPGGSLTTLYAFTGGEDGCFPGAAVTQGSDGKLYGSTGRCGAYGQGTLFQFTR